MTAPHATRLRDHWWIRPDRPPGRDVLTWHLTFDDAPALHGLVAGYQGVLGPPVRPVPLPWLHATFQNAGFVDELTPSAVHAVTRAVRAEVAGVAGFPLTFHRPHVFSEAVVLLAEPEDAVAELLAAVRRGIAAALGTVPCAPRKDPFRPHVSVAYASGGADTAPFVAALDRVRAAPVTVPVTAVTFLRQQRLLAPHWHYRWTVRAAAPLAAR